MNAFGMRDWGGGFAGPVSCLLSMDWKTQGTYNVLPVCLQPKELAQVKMELITPSTSTWLASPSGISLPGKVVPCEDASDSASSHRRCERERDERSIVGIEKPGVP